MAKVGKKKHTPAQKRAIKSGATAAGLPPPTDWRTSDEHELAKRKLRAREERHRITNLEPKHPIFFEF